MKQTAKRTLILALILSFLLSIPACAEPIAHDPSGPCTQQAHAKSLRPEAAAPMPKAVSAEVTAKVKEVVKASVKSSMSDYQKAVALHDWLTMNARYDYTYKYYQPDGVLLHGKGVCNSYALAYELLCQEAGIPCKFVRNQAHAWNVVQLGGNWYHVDVTWDDPTPKQATTPISGYEHHELFGLTDAAIDASKDHKKIWSKPVTCASYEYNYDLREGRLAADIAHLSAQINRRLLKGDRKFTVKLGTQYTQPFAPVTMALVLSQRQWDTNKGPVWLSVSYSASARKVSVKQRTIKAAAIALSAPKTALAAGETMALSCAFTPETTSNKALTWKSSNAKVLKVSKRGTVTALKPGTATVTATTKDGTKKKAQITVQVEAQ